MESGICAALHSIISYWGVGLVCTRKQWKDWQIKSHPRLLPLWHACADCQVPPAVRKITTILLEAREEDNDRLKEFIFISALLHYSASPYCSCLQLSAAALLQEAGLCVTSRGAEARVCIANSQNHKLKQAVEPLLFIISFWLKSQSAIGNGFILVYVWVGREKQRAESRNQSLSWGEERIGQHNPIPWDQRWPAQA